MAYSGFISYSHAADGRLAPALQSGLQRLAKPWYRPRALRIFRDETGLSTNPHLWSSIVTALDESEWFVLLASPESAQSSWVDRELAHWLETKPADRILPALTSGEWGWDPDAGRLVGDAVPERLRAAVSEEPRHLDLRWARDETDLDLRNSRFRSAVADLAAPMHGVAKDELEGEDIRQHRRARRLARGGVTALALLVVVSLITTVFAVGQRDQAQRSSNEALARGLTAEVGAESSEHSYATALLLAAEATRFAGLAGSDPSTTRQAQEALLGTVGTADMDVRVAERRTRDGRPDPLLSQRENRRLVLLDRSATGLGASVPSGRCRAAAAGRPGERSRRQRFGARGSSRVLDPLSERCLRAALGPSDPQAVALAAARAEKDSDVPRTSARHEQRGAEQRRPAGGGAK